MGFENPLQKNRAREGGWVKAVRMPHLCFPPRSYPSGFGSGSKWLCKKQDCLTVWESHGAQILQDESDWPTASEMRAIIGPEYWRVEGWPASLEDQMDEYQSGGIQQVDALASGAKEFETLRMEHDLYDFRGLAVLGIKYQKLFAEAQGLNWKAIYD